MSYESGMSYEAKVAGAIPPPKPAAKPAANLAASGMYSGFSDEQRSTNLLKSSHLWGTSSFQTGSYFDKTQSVSKPELSLKERIIAHMNKKKDPMNSDLNLTELERAPPKEKKPRKPRAKKVPAVIAPSKPAKEKKPRKPRAKKNTAPQLSEPVKATMES
jgi:hypothetical protein